MSTFLLFLLMLVLGGSLWVLCGMGPYLWLRSAVPHQGLAGFGICAGLGLALLGGVATQVFYLEIAPIWTIILTLAVSLVLIAAAVWVRRGAIRESAVGLWRGAWEDREFGIGGVILAAIVFFPGYRDSFGQPFRIGIDQVGYAVTTQYLLEGGTASELRDEIVRQTGQPTVAMALNAHVTSLNFNTTVAAEFLLKAHRFGYPMVLAGIGQMFGLNTIVDYQFCLLAVPWFCSLLLLLWFFREVLILPDLVAKAMAAGVAMNPNQLNVLFEGQHAQIVVFPLLVMFFGMLYWHRQEVAAGRRAQGTFVALTGVGIFALYSDSFIALGVVGGALWLADLLSRDWPALRRTTLFGAVVTLGLLVLNRYTFDWVGFILRHLANLNGGHGGWPQPHWASPAEIVGYFSMYRGGLGNLLPRSTFLAIGEATVVGAMVGALVLGGYRALRDARVARYWLVPALVCLWVYVDLRWLKGFHNYGYTKVFTLLLVPLAGLHWITLHAWFERGSRSSALLANWTNRAVAAIAAVVILTGLIDSGHFVRTSERLSTEVGRALRQVNREVDISSYAILTYPEGGVGAATLGGYAPFNWLNISWSDKYLAPHRDKPLLIVVFGVSQELINRAAGTGRVLYRGDEVVIISTGRRVADLGLPQSQIVADRQTTSLNLTHAQFPIFTAFLRQQLGLEYPKSAVP